MSACASGWAQGTPAPADTSAIVAETQQNARKQGMVRIGKSLWKCSDRRCTATTKYATTNVFACQALAELVGPLARFGRVERPMPSYDLALCNVRAQIKLARLEQERERALAGRTKNGANRVRPPALANSPVPSLPSASSTRSTVPPVVDVVPAVPVMPSPSPSAPRFAVQVARLSILGVGDPTGHAAPPLLSKLTTHIKVDPLGVAGHGRLAEAVPGTHLTVEVEKLELIGR